MARLKKFIVEIHRRSLWQVLAAYIGASWFVMEATDQIVDRYLLPEWVYPAALILLLVGLPIVLATALVREEKREPKSESIHEVRDPTLLGDVSQEAARPAVALAGAPIAKFLTWPRAIAGGVLAFTALGLVSALIVMRGTARVTEAYGAAGEAFEERAWIVVADFDAEDNAADVAPAALTALTVDLQQSQYVNVYGRDQITPVLARMGLPDTTSLDRGLALEVAEREGLAAVLAPEVSRLGADYVFGARVIQPGSREELIAVRAAAREERLLEGVESLSREVRSRLGEASDEIRRSKPLPEVTTRSLEALKKYAQAEEAISVDNDPERAAEIIVDAIRLDSTFAMAERLLGVASNNLGRFGEAIDHTRRAFELRDRLTDRERMHVEAFYYYLSIEPRRAAEAYERIVSQYPDDTRASNNLGVVSDVFLGEYERGQEAYHRAVELNPYSALYRSNLISATMTVGRWDEADSLMEAAVRDGLPEAAARNRLPYEFVRGDLGTVEALCDSLLAATSGGPLARYRTECGTIDVARGWLTRGVDRLDRARRYFEEERRYLQLHLTVRALASAEQMRRRSSAAASHVEDLIDHLSGDSLGELDRFYMRTNLRVASGLMGRPDLMDAIEAVFPPYNDTTHWQSRYGEAMAGAARELANDAPAGALALLREGTAGDNEPVFWQSELTLMYGLAFEGLGQSDSAIVYLEKSIDPTTQGRWLRLNLPLTLRRLAELEDSRGNTEAAAGYYQRFLELWSDADPELQGDVDAARRSLARLTGEAIS